MNGYGWVAVADWLWTTFGVLRLNEQVNES